ncbi:HAD family hydrolase [Leifsonia shinshuensis]|uniref:HAD superfamily hydrolase (TIGR01549 family) n=1 Tax=Leifsonia shinshuensis TaxID=150026 RepID=A0A853CMU4_9MICO|nr:HAD family hydrolase [Leifsonia shinshuensis]NYJ22166.1 HAD superfamily hydrolase (TIGR01549 family) [Leifsonia shinshuensis]
MTLRTVLFDVDGTLVDSNYLHIDAWQRAFAELDAPVDAWRVHRALGRDSAQLLRAVAGERDDEWNERAKALHAAHFRELAPRLRAFDGAADLLRAVSARGVRVVLATSAAADELELLRRALGADDAVHAATSADDVDEAKPDPGILEVALRRADATASEALVVGDSVWDMTAAARARIRPVGVLCGGVGAAELTDAGARAVFDGPAALLEALDSVL